MLFRSASGLRGSTVWYTTQSYSDMLEPPSGIPELVGSLYIHKNLSIPAHQIWMFDREARWVPVPDDARVNHPTVAGRMLSIRSDGSPNWVSATGFANVKNRRVNRISVVR